MVLMREKRHVCVGRLFKMARLFTLPTPATISPACPESARTASLPMDAPLPRARPQRLKRGEVEVKVKPQPSGELAGFFNSLLVQLLGDRVSKKATLWR